MLRRRFLKSVASVLAGLFVAKKASALPDVPTPKVWRLEWDNLDPTSPAELAIYGCTEIASLRQSDGVHHRRVFDRGGKQPGICIQGCKGPLPLLRNVTLYGD